MDRRATIAAIGVVSMLMLAGCGSSSSGSTKSGGSGSTGSGAESTTHIKVGTAPTLSGTSFYLADQDGTFAKNHLSATAQVMTSGAQAIPLLLNGQVQFTVADAVGAIKAISQNIPLEIVAQGPIVSPDPAKDNAALVVGSGVNSVQDLAGKTVAVNALGSFSQLAVEKSVDLAGGDSSKIKYVEIPIPQMAAAVKAGTVAGATISEPFLSQSKALGLKDLTPILNKVFPEAPMLVYLASTSYASSHPQVIKDFAASITAANTTLANDPAKLKSVGGSVAKMTPAQLDAIILPTYVPAPVSLDALKAVMAVMVEYKVLTAPIDIQSHVFGP